MNRYLLRISFSACLLTAGWTICKAEDTTKAESSALEPPVRLKVDGKVLDTGGKTGEEVGAAERGHGWGHSAPCVEDLDGDGLKDLIVGDFSGHFHYFRNVGSAKEPVYQDAGKIQAGGNDAEVTIYCCIGGQPRFFDLDGDGIRDMISNSYNPGHCYLFRGLKGHQFAAREELLDKAGVPVRSSPAQKDNFESYCSFYEPVDWDGDGDFDLLIGTMVGELMVRINEGTPTKPEFATNNILIEVDGKPLKVNKHLCPVVADWDGDGKWDIIAGCIDGSVTWFRNTGTKSAPAFAAGQLLVGKHTDHGYIGNGILYDGHNRAIWKEEEIVPGIRSQVEVTDYNGDGKLDLLVGDFYSAYDFKEKLTDEQVSAVKNLLAHSESIGKEYCAKRDWMYSEIEVRYPGDEKFGDKAQKEYVEAFENLTKSPEAKKMKQDEKDFGIRLRPFLSGSTTSDQVLHQSKGHGHVWLFLRK